MKLASLKSGRDGLLVVVSRDLSRCAEANAVAPTLQAALDAQLGDQDFLAAAALTIADLCCYGEAAFARMSGFDLAPWPNVANWSARIEARPGFKPPLELLPMANAEIAP